MTCIAAVADGKKVWMGADSVSGHAELIEIVKTPKLIKRGGVLIGFTWSWRMGQLLNYSLEVPARPSRVSVAKYMSTHLIDAIRQCFKDGGWGQKKDEREIGGQFLLGYAGRVARVCSDFSVTEQRLRYSACGSGEEFALGVLHDRWHETGMSDPPEAIRAALDAAEYHCPFVRRPFHIKEIG